MYIQCKYRHSVFNTNMAYIHYSVQTQCIFSANTVYIDLSALPCKYSGLRTVMMWNGGSRAGADGKFTCKMSFSRTTTPRWLEKSKTYLDLALTV